MSPVAAESLAPRVRTRLEQPRGTTYVVSPKATILPDQEQSWTLRVLKSGNVVTAGRVCLVDRARAVSHAPRSSATMRR